MLNIYIFKIVLLCFIKKECLLYFCIWKLWFLKFREQLHCFCFIVTKCWKNNVNQYQVFDNINRKGKIYETYSSGWLWCRKRCNTFFHKIFNRRTVFFKKKLISNIIDDLNDNYVCVLYRFENREIPVRYLRNSVFYICETQYSTCIYKKRENECQL